MVVVSDMIDVDVRKQRSMWAAFLAFALSFLLICSEARFPVPGLFGAQFLVSFCFMVPVYAVPGLPSSDTRRRSFNSMATFGFQSHETLE